MQYEVVLSNQAQMEIDKTYVYYFENANISIANDFLSELDNSFDIIGFNPNFQQFRNNIRIFPIEKFPFLLFFEILEELKTIRVLSVFHTSQNPIKYQ